MTDIASRLGASQELAAKVSKIFAGRLRVAQERYNARVRAAYRDNAAALEWKPASPWDFWTACARCAVDFTQRWILYLDTIRQRGNAYLERVEAGLPPVLHFDYEMVMDGRTFAQPANYALVRILPPKGVTVDAKRRPYVIIDPRAGQGPGIGGFKDDSEVGVALRAGHPVYFVIFFPDPVPGQTLLDVCAAEREFVHRVRELHPDSPKPAVVGNCQGGWAAMMVASSNPEDTGPVVINGAPMSYWSGAWSEGEGDNPMRYAGGLLGGTWLASFFSDRGAGKFDGAWLVQNFDYLSPANTWWEKYYHVFANVDTEPPRFLDFERWWGGFYLMNGEEIEWITQNLFVGNRLWSQETPGGGRSVFDLRAIRSPIVLFASMGDNITPPQQAFNWVADIYESTEEIKARGQVIVGLVDPKVGHLAIFVSGKVARNSHAQIVTVLESIESLPPGLYAMEISQSAGGDGKPAYEVTFTERRLEDVRARLNRFERIDEKPFEAAAAVADLNQRAYELFAQPAVRALASESSAQLERTLHPQRVQRWAFSDLNPWLAWLAPVAHAAAEFRQALPLDHPLRAPERIASELVAASLDYYRGVRDAISEAAFFQIYGNVFVREHAKPAAPREAADPRELRYVKDALGAIDHGGYPEALARVAVLVGRKDEPLPLSRVELKAELSRDYGELVPPVPLDEARRIRGEQEIVARYEPQKALETLPALLPDAADRERLLTLLDRLLADRRVQAVGASPEQLDMLARIRDVLGAHREAAAPRRAA